jgi:AcrR family transcriptional regulator
MTMCTAHSDAVLDNVGPADLLTNQLVKKKRSAAVSHAAVFAAAVDEFAERGFDAARVDRIAARARVNKAMIYYHFGSKRELYLEVLRDVFRAVGHRIRTIADGPGAADVKIGQWVDAIVEEATQRPWFPPLMLRELASGAPRFDADTFALMNAVFAGVRDILAQGQRDRIFRTVDPLFIHLTIMPVVLMFVVRGQAVARNAVTDGVGEPRATESFVAYMQDMVARILRTDA